MQITWFSPPDLRRWANKVPEVTIFFWIIQILATTVGKTAADLLNVDVGLGLTWTSAVMAVLTVGALVVQLGSDRYVPWRYWLVVILISVMGTLITDTLVDSAGVPLATTTQWCSVALALIFVDWYAIERTLSISTITTRRRELYHWTAILATFALGTSAGDLVAERFAIGYLAAAGLFALAIALAYGLLRLGVIGAMPAFWAAYVLTRPFGASLGDWLSQSRDSGGLGLGTVGPGTVSLLVSIGLVAYLTRSRRDVASHS